MLKKQPQKKNDNTFKKNDGKPKGRPKGALNKTTARQKATIEMVMDNLAETIIDDLSQVNSSRRLQVYIDLMNYIKPKLSATKNETDVKQDVKIEVNFKPFNNRFTTPEDKDDSTGEGTVNE